MDLPLGVVRAVETPWQLQKQGLIHELSLPGLEVVSVLLVSTTPVTGLI